jgi:hypothetical protein
MSLCLSRAEIAELTRTPIRRRQVAFLRANGIRHYVDSYGWPVVVRSAIEGGPAEAGAAASKWKPNKAA